MDKSTSTSKAGSNCTPFTYRWVIDRFSEREEPYITQDFSLPSDDRKQFRLVIFPSHFDRLHFTRIYAFFNSSDIPKDEAWISIAILDRSGNPTLQTEGNLQTLNPGGQYRPEIMVRRKYLLDSAKELLFDDNLTIMYKIFHGENKHPISVSDHLTEMQTLQCDFQRMLTSGTHSDVIFVVGGEELRLHKTVLASRSPVFEAMFSADLEEKKQNRVQITDVPVETFKALLEFIYTGTVTNLAEHAYELFIVSDKYQLESLKHICEKALGNNLTTESVVVVILLAEMHSANMLKAKCMQFIRMNVKQVTGHESWLQLKSKPDLLMELYVDLSHSVE